jgi:hypothetical protein
MRPPAEPLVKPKYAPHPGSQAETLVNLILAAEGSLRTGDLARASGIPSTNIQGSLDAAINNGLITCCKVTVGNEVMREYRAGPGMPHATEKPLAKPLQGRPVIPVRSAPYVKPGSGVVFVQCRDPVQFSPTPPVEVSSTDQPAVSTNTGSAPSGPSSNPFPEGRTVIDPPPEIAKPPAADNVKSLDDVVCKSIVDTALAAHAGRPREELRIGLHITHDAELAIFVRDEIPIYLTAAQTLVLGDFLHAVQALWRP